MEWLAFMEGVDVLIQGSSSCLLRSLWEVIPWDCARWAWQNQHQQSDSDLRYFNKHRACLKWQFAGVAALLPRVWELQTSCGGSLEKASHLDSSLSSSHSSWGGCWASI